MGKKNRKKHRSPQLAKQSKPLRPDDYFRRGPFEMARFGKNVITHNSMTNEQHADLIEHAAERLPEVIKDINSKISTITDLMERLPASEVLKRAHWGMAKNWMFTGEEQRESKEQVLSARMVDYLQSIIAATNCPVGKLGDEIDEDDWQLLETSVGDLFDLINFDYPFCYKAKKQRTEPINEDIEEFRFKSQLYWTNVRGDRFFVHEIPFYKALFQAHDTVFKELFDCSSNDFITNLEIILHSLTRGISETISDMMNFQKESTSKLEEKLSYYTKNITESDLPELMEEVIKENGLERRKNDILGRMMDLDLFDLEKITTLPKALLTELSWDIGANPSFLADGDHKGWPLRVWPIFERPFIKLGDRYCCFELHCMFDHLYRVIQRTVTRLRPEYKTEWKEKQTEVSETLPLELFEEILPDCKTYRSVFYGSKKQRKEIDGLVLCDDHLIAIEVKAGAFTYTSPATDFDAHISSLETLVLNPSKQGGRFIDHLNKQNHIKIYDAEGNSIGKLNSDDWQHKTICSITLDPFTGIAAQIQHLKKIGLDVGTQPIWQISISDLFVYVDLFNNPLVFLHYLEQRNLAFESELLELDDELDHIGLYLKHNGYAQYAKELTDGVGRIRFDGYRTEIDTYYAQKAANSKTICTLKQELPHRLDEIISFLAANNIPHRRVLSSLLLNCAGEWRDNIARGIEDVLIKQRNMRRARPLAVCGDDFNITIFCWQSGIVERDASLAREHTFSSMMITNDADRTLIELSFDGKDSLRDIQFIEYRQEDIPDQEGTRLQDMANELKEKRIHNSQLETGKIGRNAPCPCGSGRKYKKCCGVA